MAPVQTAYSGELQGPWHRGRSVSLGCTYVCTCVCAVCICVLRPQVAMRPPGTQHSHVCRLCQRRKVHPAAHLAHPALTLEVVGMFVEVLAWLEGADCPAEGHSRPGSTGSCSSLLSSMLPPWPLRL